jgi:hypothetical protein
VKRTVRLCALWLLLALACMAVAVILAENYNWDHTKAEWIGFIASFPVAVVVDHRRERLTR